MATWYTGHMTVAGVRTTFEVQTAEALSSIVIQIGTEGVTFANETITVDLTTDTNYNDSAIETLIVGDTDVESASVSGQSTEIDSSHWTGTISMSAAPEKAQWAIGTKLQRQDPDSEEYEDIAKIMDISGPGYELDLEDVTGHDSPGGWEEQIGTILRSGEISLEIAFLPTNSTHTALVKDMFDRAIRNYKVIFPDADNTEWSFEALVTGFEPSAPVEGALGATITLKPHGQPTLAGVND